MYFHMKKLFLLLFLVTSMSSWSQVAINIDASAPDNSAMLDVKSTSRGVLLPRLTFAQRNAIISPATGLIIYQSDNTSGFYYNSGTPASPVWVISGTGAGWGMTGNAGTNPAANYIGTADNQPLRFRTNNSWAGELNPVTANVYMGGGAGQANTTGNSNVAVGEHALNLNTIGGYNTSVGYYALSFSTTGSDNSASGAYALYHNTTGIDNTATGRNALFANTTGSMNSATGKDAMLASTIGDANVAGGYRTLYSNLTGGYNCAIGFQSLYSNVSGNNNAAYGSMSLNSNITGNANTSIGDQSMSFNLSGNSNVAVGSSALLFNLADNNTAIGSGSSPNNTSGTGNTAIGYQSFFYNTGGSSNMAAGYRALFNNIGGNYNTAIGYNALSGNQYGSENVALGESALYANVSGTGNIAIGHNSGTHPNTTNLYNTISIGNDGFLNAYQNQVFIGNMNTAYIGGKVTWSTFSDERIKNSIREDVKGLEFINRLRPVTYLISNQAITNITGNKETPDYPGKNETETLRYTGFIAQEVEQAATEVAFDFSAVGKPKNQYGLYTLSYEQFVVPLVKAVQELSKINEEQNTTIGELKQSMDLLKSQNEQLKLWIAKLESR